MGEAAARPAPKGKQQQQPQQQQVFEIVGLDVTGRE